MMALSMLLFYKPPAIDAPSAAEVDGNRSTISWLLLGYLDHKMQRELVGSIAFVHRSHRLRLSPAQTVEC